MYTFDTKFLYSYSTFMTSIITSYGDKYKKPIYQWTLSNPWSRKIYSVVWPYISKVTGEDYLSYCLNVVKLLKKPDLYVLG